jgi:hypothetical protein
VFEWKRFHFGRHVSLQAIDKTQTTIARLILSLLGDEDWLVVEGAARQHLQHLVVNNKLEW